MLMRYQSPFDHVSMKGVCLLARCVMNSTHGWMIVSNPNVDGNVMCVGHLVNITTVTNSICDMCFCPCDRGNPLCPR